MFLLYREAQKHTALKAWPYQWWVGEKAHHLNLLVTSPNVSRTLLAFFVPSAHRWLTQIFPTRTPGSFSALSSQLIRPYHILEPGVGPRQDHWISPYWISGGSHQTIPLSMSLWISAQPSLSISSSCKLGEVAPLWDPQVSSKGVKQNCPWYWAPGYTASDWPPAFEPLVTLCHWCQPFEPIRSDSFQLLSLFTHLAWTLLVCLKGCYGRQRWKPHWRQDKQCSLLCSHLPSQSHHTRWLNTISSPCYADRSKSTSCLSYLKIILALVLHLLQSKLLFWFFSFHVYNTLTNSCTSTNGDVPKTTNNLCLTNCP